MANMVLACFFAGRGIYHLLDNDEMVWYDIVMVIFNIILALI